MKKVLSFLFIFCYIALGSRSIYAQNLKYSFKQITIEEGLSQSTVNCMLRDSRGALWIGTQSGLNRFEKNEVKCYFNELGNPTSIPGNTIYTITEDGKGRIWVSTANGLALYSVENDNFTTVLNDQVFSSINLESGILFSSYDYLLSYDEHSEQIKRIDLSQTINRSKAPYCKIIDIKKRDLSTIVLTTNHMGVFMYDLKTSALRKMQFGNVPYILDLYIDLSGKYYLSSFNNGLYIYDENVNFLAQYTTANSDLSNNIIMCMDEMNGQIWMATDGGGINILNPVTRNITSIQHVSSNKNSLPVNSITTLYRDKDVLWAGSVRGGAIWVKETPINTYPDVALNSKNGLSEKAVISLFEDKNEMLWVGTDGGGINLYNPQTGYFKHYASTYRDKVVSITYFSQDELLVSLFGRGVFTFNKRTATYQPFLIGDKKMNNIQSSGYMPLVHRVSENKIYFFAKDLLVYDTRKKTFSPINVAKGGEIPVSLRLMFLDDTTCFAAGNHKIFSLDIENDSIRTLLTTNTNERINTLSYDKDSLLWIGTNHGLSNFNIYTHKFSRIATKLFSTVSYLLHDENNRLWICAQNMLYSYISNEKRFVVWSESDGFLPNEILSMFQKKSATGNIYLGGSNGLVIIDKNIQLPKNILPKILLHNIELNGKSTMRELKQKEIKIPYNYTSLAVITDVNERDLFRNTLFRYTVKGNTETTYESYSYSLNLPSLSPGEYEIFVSCNTKSGDWTPAVQLLTIVITPPWYKTSLFILFLVLGIALIILTIIITFFRSKQKKLLERMRTQEQKMNESKIQFLINISHELRTPLTLIYAPLKRLIENKDLERNWEEFKKILLGIYKQADMMKNIINMTLDISKLDAGISALNLSNLDLNDWIKSIAEDFRTEYKGKNIRLVYKLDERIGKLNFDEAKCSIILSNFLMNALKFGEPNTEVCVTTNIKESMIRISVSDEGIGLDNVQENMLFTKFYQGKHNQKGTGIGLSYAKQLVEAQEGNIGAYSNDTRGAIFYYEIPINLGTKTESNMVTEPESIVPITDIDYAFDEKTILIIEDNEDLCTFLKEIMQPIFKQVYLAGNGLEGLNLIEKYHPDILVSDIMMPNLNGFELCKKIKENIHISHIPVILLTAKGDQESVSLGYKLGADAYLSKPFQTDVLLAVIRNILRSRDQVKELFSHGEAEIVPADVTISAVDEHFILKLNKLIENNLCNENLNVDFLTHEMAMGRTSLYAKIKALTGMGVNDYLNKMRIDRACHLLVHTDKDITEIAYQIGLSYQRYFSTLFKKLKGCTPSEYRASHRKHPTHPVVKSR